MIQEFLASNEVVVLDRSPLGHVMTPCLTPLTRARTKGVLTRCQPRYFLPFLNNDWPTPKYLNKSFENLGLHLPQSHLIVGPLGATIRPTISGRSVPLSRNATQTPPALFVTHNRRPEPLALRVKSEMDCASHPPAELFSNHFHVPSLLCPFIVYSSLPLFSFSSTLTP